MDPDRPSDALIGYCRVSTDKQDTELQRLVLTAAGCWRIFEETISSGKKKRPVLDFVLKYAEPGNTVAVYAISRMARSTIETLTIAEDLKARGIGLKSMTEPINTSTPEGTMFLSIMSSFAQYERDMIRRRTSAGLAAARAKGHFGGAPRKLTGAKLAKAKKLLADGLTQTEAAAAIGVSRSTLVRWAINDGYPGGPKERAEFLKRRPNPEDYFAASENPLYGLNPARRGVWRQEHAS